MQLQRGVKATWWNNIWAQTGAYTPGLHPPPPLGITPYDGQGTTIWHANESPSRVVLIGYMNEFSDLHSMYSRQLYIYIYIDIRFKGFLYRGGSHAWIP